MCIEEGCEAESIYNNAGETEALYCNKHKLDAMINSIDSKLCCINDGCYVIASFNYEGEEKGLYCNKHKLENMINTTFKYI